MTELPHYYIAEVFSSRLEMVKPHTIVEYYGLVYICYHMEWEDHYARRTLHFLLHDHIFNPSVWNIVAKGGADRLSSPSSLREASDLVSDALDFIKLRIRDASILTIPYKGGYYFKNANTSSPLYR